MKRGGRTMQPASALFIVALTLFLARPALGQQLEVHYINVGQGGSTLIVGPDGTTILYDFGNLRGDARLVPYLCRLPLFAQRRTIDFAIISHADRDHFKGYKDLIEAGFEIRLANFEPGTAKSGGEFEQFALQPALQTPAGAFRPIPVGFLMPLGNEARALVMAANAKVFGEAEPATTRRKPPKLNENDRSVSLFIEFGEFEFVLDGDLGSGPEACTQHVTSQKDVQTRVARALLAHGLIAPDRGVDILHIAHHGSESSTSAEYFRLMKPEVGIISVGPIQGTFRHPRRSVVESVLTCRNNGVFAPDACVPAARDTRAQCVRDVPALRALFQTDYGNDTDCLVTDVHCVSNIAMTGGNIVVRTDGRTGYSITVDGDLVRTSRQPNITTPRTFDFALD